MNKGARSKDLGKNYPHLFLLSLQILPKAINRAICRSRVKFVENCKFCVFEAEARLGQGGAIVI